MCLSRAITDSLTATITVTSVGDPVASGITGGSPGHCDTSATMLDCCHITGRCGICREEYAVIQPYCLLAGTHPLDGLCTGRASEHYNMCQATASLSPAGRGASGVCLSHYAIHN